MRRCFCPLHTHPGPCTHLVDLVAAVQQVVLSVGVAQAPPHPQQGLENLGLPLAPRKVCACIPLRLSLCLLYALALLPDAWTFL